MLLKIQETSFPVNTVENLLFAYQPSIVTLKNSDYLNIDMALGNLRRKLRTFVFLIMNPIHYLFRELSLL